MKRGAVWFGIILLVLTACAPRPAHPADGAPQPGAPKEQMAAMNVITYDSADVEVVIDNLQFSPPFIHVMPGTMVTWTNRDRVRHTVAFHNRKTPTEVTESDVLEGGGFLGSYSFTFADEGVYDYICGIHPFMRGGVIVGNPPELAEMMEGAEDTPPPKVTRITPRRTTEGGVTVEVRGDNFVEGTTVFFHHLFGEVEFVDSTLLKVTVPDHYPLLMDVIVTNPDGDHVTLVEGFEYLESEGGMTFVGASAEGFTGEVRTPHWTDATPGHGQSVSAAGEISVSFNFPIVKGSTIELVDASGAKVADGTLYANRLGLRIEDVPALQPGTYTVKYHAIWLGGSAHDGSWQFAVP